MGSGCIPRHQDCERNADPGQCAVFDPKQKCGDAVSFRVTSTYGFRAACACKWEFLCVSVRAFCLVCARMHACECAEERVGVCSHVCVCVCARVCTHADVCMCAVARIVMCLFSILIISAYTSRRGCGGVVQRLIASSEFAAPTHSNSKFMLPYTTYVRASAWHAVMNLWVDKCTQTCLCLFFDAACIEKDST